MRIEWILAEKRNDISDACKSEIHENDIPEKSCPVYYRREGFDPFPDEYGINDKNTEISQYPDPSVAGDQEPGCNLQKKSRHEELMKKDFPEVIGCRLSGI